MKKYNITVNGTTYEVEVEQVGGSETTVAPTPTPSVQNVSTPQSAPAEPVAPKAAPKQTASPSKAPSADSTKVEAPMPGTILEIHVAAGDSVTEGQVLLILEAMKMENEIMAPSAGTVDTIQVAKGASVNSGDILLSLK